MLLQPESTKTYLSMITLQNQDFLECLIRIKAFLHLATNL